MAAGPAAVGLFPLTAEESSLIAPFTIPLSAFIAMFLPAAAAAASESWQRRRMRSGHTSYIMREAEKTYLYAYLYIF